MELQISLLSVTSSLVQIPRFALPNHGRYDEVDVPHRDAVSGDEPSQNVRTESGRSQVLRFSKPG